MRERVLNLIWCSQLKYNAKWATFSLGANFQFKGFRPQTLRPCTGDP